ncbi:uncharacterized protein LOC126907337 isoform X2 [Daktulosphaira vitifoliae]|uniref:uncharacterized protein LOC126907337 isoform X2 n=1 Tax=Daktulosphaira vitifoliae TaxID=58002 RepID=UPI0021AA8829|nr:uncharacterized protein LOC126907337 isoform X2 [Daktulosphaira vitifoliae]
MINFSTAMEYMELNCNFSKYILNYFKHNEKYLLKLEEDKTNISKRDLKMYGKAIQSHGEIIIAMLEALRSEERENYPSPLMDVNLYLNNVSGSVELSFKNNSGKFEKSNRKLNLLNGFLMIHKAMVELLENCMNNICSDVSFDEVFTNCPDFNEMKDYRINFLPGVIEKLQNRLSKNNFRLKDERLNLNNSEVFRILEIALKNDSRWDFHPKKLLYYDLMMGHQIFDERNLMSGVQYRKLPEVKEHRALNVIDYFKFAPLQYKCPDDSYLTLFDVFRYMKYNFDSIQLQGYQELVLASTIRPIILLAHEIRNNMSIIGSIIIKQLEDLNNLSLFQIQTKTYLDNLCNYIRNILKIEHSQSYVEMVDNIMKQTRSFFNKNDLNKYFGIIVDIKMTGDNVSILYNEFAQLVDVKSTYLIELEKYQESLNTVNKTRYINEFFFKNISKELFKFKPNLLKRLCSQNIYMEVYNMENPESIDDKNTCKDKLIANISSKLNISLPMYMIDYILYI